MDGDMWTHPATVANVARLRDVFGYSVVAPGSGPLASGQVGVGRLAELPAIVDAVVAAVAASPVRQPLAGARPPVTEGPPREADLTGRRIVITAGGTREPIDPVRYIGNRSTGKMGLALADAAVARGAHVTLIAAAVEVALPQTSKEIHVKRVETTGQLEEALLDAMDPGGRPPDALVMAAAVADFTPLHPADKKISRGDGLTLELAPTADLLSMISVVVEANSTPPYAWSAPTGGWPRPILVGFAAETGNLDRAPAKLAAKGVDLLVANDVSEPGSGFGTDTNRVTILDRGGAVDELPLLSKREVADRILDRVARALDARDAAAQTSIEQPAGAREGQST
jgi:phosphopantothenoylcysteine decarboxylase/phosphopantothenate--cysteine ligase